MPGFNTEFNASISPCNPIANQCFDNVKNGSETGVDCGGNCNPCSECGSFRKGFVAEDNSSITLNPNPTIGATSINH